MTKIDENMRYSARLLKAASTAQPALAGFLVSEAERCISEAVQWYDELPRYNEQGYRVYRR